MRCLITGGAGFIGRHLVADLAARGGWDLCVLDDESVGDRRALDGTGAAFVQGDVRDPEVLDAVVPGCAAVIHLAAMSGVAASVADPRASLDVNLWGSFELLEACRRHGVTRIVAASTGGALAGDGRAGERAGPVSVDTPPRPRAPYGAGKAALEALLSAYAGSYGLRPCALRFANVYGPDMAHKDSVVACFLARLAAGKPLVVHGDGHQARDFLYVGDLVAGVRQALTTGATGVYPLGSGRATTIRALVAAIVEVTGRAPPEVIHAPLPAGEVRSVHCDISAARASFGFDPATSLETGLAHTWAWFAARAGFDSPGAAGSSNRAAPKGRRPES